MKKIKVDKTWTLFLDRDGVINKKLENDYVKNIQEFEFLPDALLAIKNLSQIFKRIIIVTNQRGIGRKLMSEKDLQKVHEHMYSEIEKHGGKIDNIYFCPHLEDTCSCRKPGPGLGLKAKQDFPDIDFNKSIIVGDSISDIEFGKGLNMICVHITKNKSIYNFTFESLFQFQQTINLTP